MDKMGGPADARAVAINGILVLDWSLPCAWGFQRELSDVTIPAIGDIQSIEDFIVKSNNMLRLGRTRLQNDVLRPSTYGWGWG